MANNYDLEQRTEQFAKDVRQFIRLLTLDLSNYEDSKQLTRSSGSVGANYIEANEKLGDKDFKFRAKIARKEAKESRYWLRLIDTLGNKEVEQVRIRLEQEATELLKILSAIINKV
ncbi:four helix bundle protein [uncultured Roseivirga sp.]|uniref:four helix bundle protein n=1 Tax=uncultured Roseivirga sp. TaxID=543088 RepID=UPI0030D728F1